MSLGAPPRLYAIADLDLLGHAGVVPAVAAMADAGVRWIQLRLKGASGALVFALTQQCCELLRGSGVRLWLDDRADVAALAPVGGLHVGQTDLPPAAARRVVPADVAIGASTHDLSQLALAAADPTVDVVAVGPIFPTRSKAAADPVVGTELLRQARRLTTKPLVAIGGIDETNLAAVLAAGADTAAVLSAACRGDVAASCRTLLAAAGGP